MKLMIIIVSLFCYYHSAIAQGCTGNDIRQVWCDICKCKDYRWTCTGKPCNVDHSASMPPEYQPFLPRQGDLRYPTTGNSANLKSMSIQKKKNQQIIQHDSNKKSIYQRNYENLRPFTDPMIYVNPSRIVQNNIQRGLFIPGNPNRGSVSYQNREPPYVNLQENMQNTQRRKFNEEQRNLGGLYTDPKIILESPVNLASSLANAAADTNKQGNFYDIPDHNRITDYSPKNTEEQSKLNNIYSKKGVFPDHPISIETLLRALEPHRTSGSGIAMQDHNGNPTSMDNGEKKRLLHLMRKTYKGILANTAQQIENEERFNQQINTNNQLETMNSALQNSINMNSDHNVAQKSVTEKNKHLHSLQKSYKEKFSNSSAGHMKHTQVKATYSRPDNQPDDLNSDFYINKPNEEQPSLISAASPGKTEKRKSKRKKSERTKRETENLPNSISMPSEKKSNLKKSMKGKSPFKVIEDRSGYRGKTSNPSFAFLPVAQEYKTNRKDEENMSLTNTAIGKKGKQIERTEEVLPIHSEKFISSLNKESKYNDEPIFPSKKVIERYLNEAHPPKQDHNDHEEFRDKRSLITDESAKNYVDGNHGTRFAHKYLRNQNKRVYGNFDKNLNLNNLKRPELFSSNIPVFDPRTESSPSYYEQFGMRNNKYSPILPLLGYRKKRSVDSPIIYLSRESFHDENSLQKSIDDSKKRMNMDDEENGKSNHELKKILAELAKDSKNNKEEENIKRNILLNLISGLKERNIFPDHPLDTKDIKNARGKAQDISPPECIIKKKNGTKLEQGCKKKSKKAKNKARRVRRDTLKLIDRYFSLSLGTNQDNNNESPNQHEITPDIYYPKNHEITEQQWYPNTNENIYELGTDEHEYKPDIHVNSPTVENEFEPNIIDETMLIPTPREKLARGRRVSYSEEDDSELEGSVDSTEPTQTDLNDDLAPKDLPDDVSEYSGSKTDSNENSKYGETSSESRVYSTEREENELNSDNIQKFDPEPTEVPEELLEDTSAEINPENSNENNRGEDDLSIEDEENQEIRDANPTEATDLVDVDDLPENMYVVVSSDDNKDDTPPEPTEMPNDKPSISDIISYLTSLPINDTGSTHQTKLQQIVTYLKNLAPSNSLKSE